MCTQFKNPSKQFESVELSLGHRGNAYCQNSIRDLACDHRSRADHRISSDPGSRENRDACAKPYPIPDLDHARHVPLVLDGDGRQAIDSVVRCAEDAAHRDQNVFSDSDLAAIRDDECSAIRAKPVVDPEFPRDRGNERALIEGNIFSESDGAKPANFSPATECQLRASAFKKRSEKKAPQKNADAPRHAPKNRHRPVGEFFAEFPHLRDGIQPSPRRP